MQIKPSKTGNDSAIGQGKGTDGSVFVTPSDFNQNDIIPFGTIGEIVDVRTYRRWLPEQRRRETAYERWARVINYNLNLVSHLQDPEELREEGLLMARKFSHLLADASGRTKWVGGTEAAEKHAASQFNCAATAVNRLSAFSDAFHLLMLGTGVGYRVFSKDISQLPPIVNQVEIEFIPYVGLPKNKRLEDTEYVTGHDFFVIVGDSRQGWVDAVMAYLMVITSPLFASKKIIFDFNSVRPAGERLNGFGGTASGHEALAVMIQDIHRIISEIPGDRFRSIDCLDIMCAIAKGVVAGSARRSAMICLFEQGDDLCANAKKGLYTNPELAHKSYRSQSNNTECMLSRPTLEDIKERLETCKTEGEPGFNNYSEMVRRRKVAAETWRPNEPVDKFTDVVTNPCHEIILSAGLDGKAGSFCNLTTLPLPNFVQDGKLNLTELESSVRLNVRISLRQTCVNIPMSGWDDTQKEERLLGVSVTGWQDAFTLLGWQTGDVEIETLLTFMREWANDEATKYAAKLGVPRPLLVTAVKPEGTASQVFGVSNGLHWDWAPYYIRRVRMTGKDALAQTLMDQGFPCYPELYDLDKVRRHTEYSEEDWAKFDGWQKLKAFDGLLNFEKRHILNNSNTVVFEFPVKSYSDRTQSEVSAIEQLENLKAFTLNYCDHMPSVTISVKDDEWEDVAEWIDANWDSFITASFFPYYDAKYPLLPYEAIDQSEYETRLAAIPERWKVTLPNGRNRFVIDELLLNKNEWQLDEVKDDEPLSDCNSGACPVR